MTVISTNTALVVEDDFASRQYLTFLLKRLNIEAIVAENGEDALQMMEHETVKFMLLDIALGPGISGIQLCEKLKAEERFLGTPAIAVTAFSREHLDEFDRVGFHGYLPKPYTFEQLETILKELAGID